MLAESHFSFLNYSWSVLSGARDSEEADRSASQGRLTARQEQIMQLISRGHGCDRIADQLQLPVRAVEGHAYRILELLGISSMDALTESVINAYRARLEPRNEPVVSEFLTVAEIALSMQVSKMTVYRLVQSGTLESVRFGRSYRVTQLAVQHYLDSISATTMDESATW